MDTSPEEIAKALLAEKLSDWCYCRVAGIEVDWDMVQRDIAKAIKDAVEAEREECANLVQHYREDKPGTFAELGRRMRIALAIRSRSEKAPHRPVI